MTFQTLIGSDAIQARIPEMGQQISAEMKGQDLIVLCVLKGAVFFMADLVRHISLDLSIDFIQVSSYGNERLSSGVLTILKEPQLDMNGKAVLIVEDIIDTGLSMSEVYTYICSRGASVVKVATFLDKPASRKKTFVADYVGFTIEPNFVIGYGLDYAEKYRNLNEIRILS